MGFLFFLLFQAHVVSLLLFRLILKMWLQNQKEHTVSTASGRPASPPSLWQSTGFTVCCLPSLASQWHSSGASTLPFSLSCTSGQLYRALRVSWLRFSASAVSIPSTSTPSVTRYLRLLAKYSAISASTCRKKYKWRFKDRRIYDSFFPFNFLSANFKLLVQQQHMNEFPGSEQRYHSFSFHNYYFPPLFHLCWGLSGLLKPI